MWFEALGGLSSDHPVSIKSHPGIHGEYNLKSHALEVTSLNYFQAKKPNDSRSHDAVLHDVQRKKFHILQVWLEGTGIEADDGEGLGFRV